MTDHLRISIVGSGLKAQEYAKNWLQIPGVSIVAITDTNPAALENLASICKASGHAAPAQFDSIERMIAACKSDIDAVYVSTPHAFHADGALAVIEAKIDLLLEKPMVTTVTQAKQVMAAHAAAGITVVVAYQGALSPLVRDTSERARAGEFGELISISGNIWENWSLQYQGQWKQQPEISGGGFMFDTGAHLMNTVCVLANSDFCRISAYMQNRNRPVDIVSAVAGRLENGALVTMNAVGDVPFECASTISLFFEKAEIRIDAWGGWREIRTPDTSWKRENSEILDTPLLTFMSVREGKMQNPSTVEHGLRLSKLWDAIKLSAKQDGEAVSLADLQ